MRQLYIKHHGKYYLTLLSLMTIGVIFAYYTREDKQLEMIVLITMAIVYILFGIIHHYLIHDFSSKIVIEYVAMGSLGLAIVLFIMKGTSL